MFGQLIAQLEERRPADFASGFIAESPAKLRRLQQYFAAVLGQRPIRRSAVTRRNSRQSWV